nr:hypothetical protein [Fibrobacter succinogenes]
MFDNVFIDDITAIKKAPTYRYFNLIGFSTIFIKNIKGMNITTEEWINTSQIAVHKYNFFLVF